MPVRSVWITVLYFLTCVSSFGQTCPFQIIAGPPSSSAGDGGRATSSWLSAPTGISVDTSGKVYIADTHNNRIRVVGANGNIQTFAGNGVQGSTGDGGLATAASLSLPQAVFAAPDGSVYIADSGNNRIRRVTPDGMISAFAGNGHAGFSGDRGPAISAWLSGPRGLALDADGGLYFADTGNNRIRKVDAGGTITTVAGKDHPTSATAFGGDGGPAAQALLSQPGGIAFAHDGSMLIADTNNYALRRVAPNGMISTIAGGPQAPFANEFPAPSSTNIGYFNNVVVQSDGSILIPGNETLLELTADGSTLQLYTLLGLFGANVGQGSDGRVYVNGNAADDVIWVVPQANAKAAPFAGQLHYGEGTSGSALGPTLDFPFGMATGPDGSLYVADRGNHRVAKITPDGTIHTFAAINDPIRLAVDSAGNVFVIDGGLFIRKITPGGTVSLYAGATSGGVPSFSEPPNTPATSVQLQYIYSIALDSNDNAYLVYARPIGQGFVLKITPEGYLQTIYSSPPGLGFQFITGQSVVAMDASQDVLFTVSIPDYLLAINSSGQPTPAPPQPPFLFDIAAGTSGNLFVVDSSNRIDQLLNGEYVPVFSGGYLGLATNFNVNRIISNPIEIATDTNGNLFVAFQNLHQIRKLAAGSCSVSPTPIINAIVDSATFGLAPGVGKTFAPGELVTLEGAVIGPSTGVSAALDASGLVPTSLSGVTVTFNGIPGPILYATANQINAIIPFELPTSGTANVQVQVNGATSNTVAILLEPSAPEVFSTFSGGTPVAIVVNEDSTLNSTTNPARAGSFITVYATGMGLTNPAGIDGHPATQPLPAPNLPVGVSLGTLLYGGDAVGLVEGAMQINIQLPSSLSTGGVSTLFGEELTIGNSRTSFSFYAR